MGRDSIYINSIYRSSSAFRGPDRNAVYHQRLLEHIHKSFKFYGLEKFYARQA